jgi:type I restriction enzyme S subunit
MNQYTKYKDSGIKWIGKVPEHWACEQLRKYLRLVSVKHKPDEPLLSVTREDGVIVRNIESKEENHNFIPEDLSNYKYVKIGQFAINKMKAWQGSYGVSKQNGIVSPAYYVCDLNYINKDFFSWAIRSKAYVGFFTQMSKGIRVGQWDLSPVALKQIPFFSPSPEEQQAIVNYLEKETSNIDAYIKQREQEINALNELKQAEIAAVVTKGLNPNVKMKDSGIPWIGEVPEHWGVDKLGKHFIQRNIKVSDKDYLPLSVSKMGVTPQLETACKTNNGDNRKLVKAGDFVVNSRSDRKGSCGFSKLDGSVSLINIVISPIDVFSDYYHFLFRSNNYVEEFYRLGRGIVADLWATRYTEMRSIMIPIPPLHEQQAIVEYIEQRVNKIDEYKATLESEIKRMQEYKQRLISDAVTGKIKVYNE